MGSVEHQWAPVPIPPPTTLRSLRTGKLEFLGNLSVKSGIVKDARQGRIRVSSLGLTDDEHDLTFHGGIDKAIHQYCSDHYPLWKEMYPDTETSSRFKPGGFGENLVADGLSESNVCIGDLVRVGQAGSLAVGGEHGALLEVSIPRQPCFKLNQRFGVKAFAAKTHQLNRTGWYYRVVEEGFIEEGMEIRIVERRHPKWTITKVHHHVHRDTDNIPAMEEALTIEEMGNESKNVFRSRLQELKNKSPGGKKKIAEKWIEYKISAKYNQTPRVMSFILESIEPILDAKRIGTGSYAHIKLANGLMRSYSIVGGTNDRIELGIARDENSRGGSEYLHDTVKIGDTLSVGKITQSVHTAYSASNHIFIAGGIGITAFLAMTAGLTIINYQVELHYAVRSEDEIAFRSLVEPLGAKLFIYDKSKGERMDVFSILRDRKWNSQVYVCGPQRMTDEVMRSAKLLEIVDDEIHYEAFQADTGGDAFTAEIESTGVKLAVGEDETLLQIMRKAGLEVDSSCEVGNCGTCQVRLCKGRVEHRGTALGTEERSTQMLSCVSRGIGHIVIEMSDE